MAKQEQLLVHILEKVDKLEEHVVGIKESQYRMEIDVATHIKRTNLLEEKVDLLRQAVDVLLIPVALIKAVLRYFRLLK